jgi:hypothetical protein
MTAKPYPHAVQKAARRGVLSAAGSKRVEVVLDAGQLIDLETIKQAYGYNNAEAVSYAISAARLVLMRDRKA